MVSTRYAQQTTPLPYDDWLNTLGLQDTTQDKLRTIVDHPETLRVGREMVEILHDLKMDDDTLQAALIFPYCQEHQLDEDSIVEQFGNGINQLIRGVRQMDAIKTLYWRDQTHVQESNVDSVRKMLLSMVEDARAVVIKMAERICVLHRVKQEDEETRVMVARECMTIYAPLANRLGIGQLKWELEDLAFRYLRPDTYKQIANKLDGKRAERNDYIDNIVDSIQGILDQERVKGDVYGRPKHIYSIWKKMAKKRLTFEQLFDIRALRIIASSVQDCYAALGAVHAAFHHIPKEFDDYIATPKPNGYQSIHTVIVGPEGKSVEIQIRTQQMHNDAELGVAAHWKYKENKTGSASAFDDRISWLRRIIQWQEEVAESGDIVEELRSQVFDDRVYVFTPRGDVIDLPMGSTPLDFAYYIHSNVGHRCIGAKVNQRIVPFTYQLQNGDQIEVLTNKQASPSRDWMHPGLGYVHSSRARATIHSYFKKQDKGKHQIAGKEILERELHRAHLTTKIDANVAKKFNLNNVDDLHAAIGAGDLKVMSVVRFLQSQIEPEPLALEPTSIKKTTLKARGKNNSIIVEGVGNLMSNIASCCKPVPGEPIVGYITQGKGVSVHKEQCPQLLNLLKQSPEREIDVDWAGEIDEGFSTSLYLYCHERDGLLRDITALLANEKISLLELNTHSSKKSLEASLLITIEVSSVAVLSHVIRKLGQIHGVNNVKRQS